MATYVIADLHLSEGEGCEKPMDIFGRRWTGYTEKLKRNWCALITPDDDVVLPGDLSWALSLDGAEADLRFIDALPGHKYLLKGNHDLWWSSMTKNRAACEGWGLKSLTFLYNNAYETGEYILAGSRGWFSDEDATGVPEDTDFEKIVAREAGRLRMSLTAAAACPSYGKKETIAFMHFPPVWNGDAVQPFIDVLKEYSVGRCYYGHVHGNYTAPAEAVVDGIRFCLISADYLDFVPRIILPDR